MFADQMSVGCNCGCDGGQGDCDPVRILVLERADGSPVRGAAVTIFNAGGGGAHVSGTTDGSGAYAPASLPMPGNGMFSAQVAYGGCSGGSPINRCGDWTFYVCFASIEVETEPGASVTIAGPKDGTGTVTADDSGSATLSICEILPAYSPSRLPEVFRARASLDGWTDNCVDATLHCGDSLKIPLPLFNYEPDYVPAPNTPHSTCDPGCLAGEGPEGRALIKQALFITINSASAAGGYSGRPIAINYIGQVGGTSWTWSSGCLDGAAVPCPAGQVKQDPDFPTICAEGPYSTYGGTPIVWPSMEVQLSFDGSGQAEVTILYHPLAGCSDGPAPYCSCSPLTLALQPGFPGCSLSSPCDVEGGFSAFGSDGSYEITD